MGKRVELKANFKIARVPLPSSMIEARRASFLMLIEWIEEVWLKDNAKNEEHPHNKTTENNIPPEVTKEKGPEWY